MVETPGVGKTSLSSPPASKREGPNPVVKVGRAPAFWKKTVYAVAFGHLCIAAVTIFHGVDRWIAGGWWEKPLAYYSSLNFAVWRYGFFSPDVGKSTEVEIKVYRDSGRNTRYSTLDGFRFFTSNIEAVNRFYGFKRHTAIDNDLRDLAARSVATRMFNICPDARRIDYTVRSVGYPPMKDYLRGVPVRKALFYTTTFELRQPEGPRPSEAGLSAQESAATRSSE